MQESRETVKTRIEVEPRFPGSHESRMTINPKNQIFLASSLENQNHKPNNYCKQTKQNSFELAESHRLFTVVNEAKAKGRETGKTQEEIPSIIRKRPIKITEKILKETI